MLSSRIVLVHLSSFLWDLNSAGARGGSSPAKLFGAVRLGRSQSSFPAAAAAVPSLEQTWAPQGSQQLPPLSHCCSRSQSAVPGGNQTGIFSPSPPLASNQAPGQESQGPSRSSCSWAGGRAGGVPSRDSKRGLSSLSTHRSLWIPPARSCLAPPAEGFEAEPSHEEKQHMMGKRALAGWDLGSERRGRKP